jgi:Ca2+-binding RTX toxin-like protein
MMANLEGEWLTSNQHRAYPLIDGVHTFVAGPNPNTVLVDACVVLLSRSSTDTSGQIKLRSISQTTVVLILGTELFTFTGGASTLSDDSKFITYRWVDQNQGAVTLILSMADSGVASGVFSYVLSTDATLDARCAEIQPLRVEQITLDAGGTLVDIGEIGELVEGYNIEIKANPETARTSLLDTRRSALRPLFNRIVLTAGSDLGMGRNPTSCGSASTDILTINKQSPDQGNFNLQGDSCYRVSRPVGSVLGDEFTAADNALRISNNCQACCDCDDFVTMLNEIRDLKNLGIKIRDMWDQVRDTYNEIKQLWDLKLACIGTGCVVQAYAYAFTGWKVQVLVWVGNPENCAKAGSSIEVSFSGGDWDPIYVPGSGMVYDADSQYTQQEPTESGGVYTMQDNNIINGGGYVVYVFSVRMRPSDDRVEGATVTVSASATVCDEAAKSLNATVELLGNVAKP